MPTISAGLGFTPPTKMRWPTGSWPRRICRPKTARQRFIDNRHALRLFRVLRPLNSLPRRNGISSVRKYPGVTTI